MCTAITYKTENHYFGRNLDLEYSYMETVTITPRNFLLKFRHMPPLKNHYALIGMSYVSDGYPLYYDATNEKGLSMAGLNFPGCAEYKPFAAGFDNIVPFEFIPWVLSQCGNLDHARLLLSHINLISEDFSSQLPCTPLHWMISDRSGSIVVESVKEGLRIHENPAEVLTNSPSFDIHMWNLNNYMKVSAADPENTFAKGLDLTRYSRGMGGMGLPGDLSSASRFVRAAFVRLNSVLEENQTASLSQFFHILGSVAMPYGTVLVGDKYEHTIYSSCCNTDLGIYYYKTYGNSRITAVDMHLENLDGSQLLSYPLVTETQVMLQNEKADA